MSTPIKDGGPAFPQPMLDIPNHGPTFPGQIAANVSGMTIRDWFAGQALAGLVFHNEFGAISDRNMAIGAYDIADAMLAEREAAQ